MSCHLLTGKTKHYKEIRCYGSSACLTDINIMNHMERKVPKYKKHKIRERKVRTLTKN